MSAMLLGYQFRIRMGRRWVEVYDFEYTAPFYGSHHHPPEAAECMVEADGVWLSPKMAPTRRRPKRVAKKIAARGGRMHHSEGRALTEVELDRLHDDADLQDALCERAGEIFREGHGAEGGDCGGER